MCESWHNVPKDSYKQLTDLVRQKGEKSDLVIILNSNMSGSTAGILAEAADRSTSGLSYTDGGSLGFIVVGSMQTRFDAKATLRINSDPDDIFKKALENLELLDDLDPDILSSRLKLEKDKASRKDLVQNLHLSFENEDPRKFHGKVFFDKCLLAPNRAKALIFDVRQVTDLKVKTFSEMIKKSKNTIVYTETCNDDTHKHDIRSCYHYLAKLSHSEYVTSWINMGRDEMIKQSGFSGQIFEIEDSKNAEDIAKVMEEIIDKFSHADLAIIFGCGRDISSRIADHIFQRSCQPYQDIGGALGTVLISTTETIWDELLSLKMNDSPSELLPKVISQLEGADVSRKSSHETKISSNSSSRKNSNSIQESMSKKSSLASCSVDSHRDSVSNQLHRYPWIDPTDKKIKDGRLFAESDTEFQILSASNPDRDCSKVLTVKAKTIISLLKISKETVIFLDSVPSVLKDNRINEDCIFNHLNKSGQLKLQLLRTMNSWKLFHILIQVGHDGIPQKAGVIENQTFEMYPDWNCNEFFKPNLDKIETFIEKADLVLFISDNLNQFQASLKLLSEKTKFGLRFQDGGSLGFVLVSPGPTEIDPLCTVRVNCEKQRFMKYLLSAMNNLETLEDFERKCSASEHRSYFRFLLQADQQQKEQDEEELEQEEQDEEELEQEDLEQKEKNIHGTMLFNLR